MGNKWYALKWPKELEEYQIAIKELFPIVFAIEVWASSLSNKKILSMSNNQAVVEIVNKTASKDPIVIFLEYLYINR